MASRKFKSGLARTLTNALFQQYAAEDAAKAQEAERAFTTSRDRARQLHETKRDIRGDMEAKNRVLEKARLESGEKFRKRQFDKTEAELDRQLARDLADKRGKTQRAVASFGRGTSYDRERLENLKALYEDAAGLSYDYGEAIKGKDKKLVEYLRKQYKKTAGVIRGMGGEIAELEDFVIEDLGGEEKITDDSNWVVDALKYMISPQSNPNTMGQQVRGLFGGEQQTQPQLQQQQGQYNEGDILQFDDGTIGVVQGGQVYPITPEELEQMMNQ